VSGATRTIHAHGSHFTVAYYACYGCRSATMNIDRPVLDTALRVVGLEARLDRRDRVESDHVRAELRERLEEARRTLARARKRTSWYCWHCGTHPSEASVQTACPGCHEPVHLYALRGHGIRVECDNPGYWWVSDVARSARWYRETFGGDTCVTCPDREPYAYARMSTRDPSMSFVLMNPESYRRAIPEAPTDGIRPCVVRINVVDVESLYERVRARAVVHTPLNSNDGPRSFSIEDPDHHLLVFRHWGRQGGSEKPTVVALARH
jgi:hypothetical protein